jgi:hypothetical protein
MVVDFMALSGGEMAYAPYTTEPAVDNERNVEYIKLNQ